MNKTQSPADVSSIIQHIWSPSDEDRRMIQRAYKLATQAHEGQMRYSGRKYVHHTIETATILADLGMDTKSIVAGLLHDTIEDAEVSTERIEEEFDEEVLFLVQGVTKLGKVRYRGMKRHIESLRKLFVATSQDIRVLIIKLADRLHNIRTLEHVPDHKQLRIAEETLEVYAPIARRLGIKNLYTQLEDEAFPYVYPDEYETVKHLSDSKYDEAIDTIEEVKRDLLIALEEAEDVEDTVVDYRLKHLFSLYQKLKKKDMDISQIYDIVALRVIVNSINECYRVLGMVHDLWRPVPNRLKDYIASPKPNGYQSLHTTVFDGKGQMAEIQIRTKDMHYEAEYGVASHVSYKSPGSGDTLEWFQDLIASMQSDQPETKDKDNVPGWIKEMTEEQQETTDPAEFMKNLQTDFFEDRIFVFTPKGDVIDLPAESSPIDFAYQIHTDLGHHISGARVNNKLCSLDTTLKDGDIVEIMTDESNSPKRKWLTYTKTTAARRKIKRAIRQKNKE